MFFPLHCTLGWVFPILYSLGCCITFVASLWILWGCTFFRCTHGEERTTSQDVVQYAFVAIVGNVGFYVSQEQTHVLLLLVVQILCHWIDIMLSNDGVRTLQMLSSPTPSELIYFTNCSFSGGCNNSYRSSKGWFLLWSVPSRHVFPFSGGGIEIYILATKWVFSLMCQHGVGSEGHWRPSSLSFAHIL
jgi:hypothetical protein